MIKKFLSYLCCLLIINLLQIFKKKLMFLTLFLQNNACLPAKTSYMTKNCIKTICFGKSDVIKLIKTLDVSKAHGHDGISVKKIKICADSIAFTYIDFPKLTCSRYFCQQLEKSYHCSNSKKKKINELFQITDQFLFYRHAVKSLKS